MSQDDKTVELDREKREYLKQAHARSATDEIDRKKHDGKWGREIREQEALLETEPEKSILKSGGMAGFLLYQAREASDHVIKLELDQVTDIVKRGHLSDAKATIELQVAAEVEAEQVDGTGRKAYTNDVARRAAADRRLETDETYQKTCHQLAQVETDLATRRAQIDHGLRDYQLRKLAYEACAIGRRV